jgi:hypothetical protein
MDLHPFQFAPRGRSRCQTQPKTPQIARNRRPAFEHLSAVTARFAGASDRSDARAPSLHARGRWFEPSRAHHHPIHPGSYRRHIQTARRTTKRGDFGFSLEQRRADLPDQDHADGRVEASGLAARPRSRRDSARSSSRDDPGHDGVAREFDPAAFDVDAVNESLARVSIR